MLLLGLAGLQGVGKDEVANYLRDRYSFQKFAFSDALYREVQEAYGLEDQELLRDRATKEVASERLALRYCTDPEFVRVATDCMDRQHHEWGLDLYLLPAHVPLSPRWVLQTWGTDYRRAQDPDYWILKTGEWLASMRRGLPEHRPNFFVECGTRFENERAWIKGFQGNIWHIRRQGIKDTTGHVSAQALPVLEGERVLYNNDTIARLHYGVDLLLRTAAPEIRVEPMLPIEEQLKTGEMYAIG